MTSISEEVLSYFQKYADEFGKLLIPRNDDEKIANSLGLHFKKFYSIDLLELCIKEYISKCYEPVVVYNFAMEAHKIREHLEEGLKDKEEIARLMKETKEFMRNYES